MEQSKGIKPSYAAFEISGMGLRSLAFSSRSLATEFGKPDVPLKDILAAVGISRSATSASISCCSSEAGFAASRTSDFGRYDAASSTWGRIGGGGIFSAFWEARPLGLWPVTRWEHEHVLEAVQRRLDEHPEKMRQRRETVEHPFGTIKARMGATHFLMKTLPRVASEMALHVLAYNLTRVMNIMGIQPLMAAIRAT